MTRINIFLKTLIDRFIRRIDQKINKMIKIISYVIISWWKFSIIIISKNKNNVKISHQIFLEAKQLNQILIYIDENVINNKIKTIAMISKKNIIMKLYLKIFICFMIYTTKFKNINIILIMIIKRYLNLIYTLLNYKL